MHAPDVDHFRKLRIDRRQLEDLALGRREPAHGLAEQVDDRERGLVHRVVLDLFVQGRIGLDDQTEIEELLVRVHLAVVARHVQIRLDEVAAGVVPVDARYLDDAHAGQAMCPPVADGGDLAAADAGIADAGPLDLDARLDHVAHRPDPDRLAGLRDLELGGGDAWILTNRRQHGVAIYREASGVVARRSAEDDVRDGKGAHLKTHAWPPLPTPLDRRASVPARRWSESGAPS